MRLGLTLGRSLALLATLWSCGDAPRPSILLFVFDTTRADAVSAYGTVAGTTPVLDGLASAGLLYTHAYAQAPWTLPSHATLFTGLAPAEHAVSWRATRARDQLLTLAERLRDAGYDTMGVSENGWIAPTFNMTQGFDRYVEVNGFKPVPDVPDVATAVRQLIGQRKTERPFFLFVNVCDAHAPYTVRPENPYLPAGVSAAEAAAVDQRPHRYFCQTAGKQRQLDIMRGLYLGDVQAADRQLGAVLDVLAGAGLTRDLVTIVTADHGEQFGTHGMVSHQFNVREPLIHVPLVVHGLAATSPAVIDAPVALLDVVPTVLPWAGVAVPADLRGRPLPSRSGGAGTARDIPATFIDMDGPSRPDDPAFGVFMRASTAQMRRACTDQDRSVGDMQTVVRYPYKLIWYARFPPQLYDLASDPGETRDLSATHPDLVASLSRSVPAPSTAGSEPPGGGTPEAPPEVLERLRALGYIDPDAPVGDPGR